MRTLVTLRRSIHRLYPHFARFLTQQSPHRHIPVPDSDPDPPFSPIVSKPPVQKSKRHRQINKKKNPKATDEVNSAVPGNNNNLPFDFMYSYSECTHGVQPIGFREPPKFSPFGPGRLDRKWTGTRAPVPDLQEANVEKFAEERARVLGDPLSEEEIADLVEKYRHSDCSRQINLGRGGVTHNTLEDIHSHWKRAEAIRVKCLGVPTLDMENISFHLEDKCGGKIIYRQMNILLLYRGRNYDPKTRPRIPVMLWKPHAPIYPKLVKNVPDGLTVEEAKRLRKRGLKSPPVMKLTRNGVYVNVVEKVRTAFESEEVVRLDCTHVGTNDCKKIGCKLRDLVPCVPLLIKDDQIILWKGKGVNRSIEPFVLS